SESLANRTMLTADLLRHAKVGAHLHGRYLRGASAILARRYWRVAWNQHGGVAQRSGIQDRARLQLGFEIESRMKNWLDKAAPRGRTALRTNSAAGGPRRVLNLHVLAKGLHRIHHYGLFALLNTFAAITMPII